MDFSIFTNMLLLQYISDIDSYGNYKMNVKTFVGPGNQNNKKWLGCASSGYE